MSNKNNTEPKENKVKKPKKQINQRKLKYGSISTAITVIFVAVVVLLNVFVVSLTERFPLNLDLTPNQVFEVSQETIDYLKTLENNVKIVVMRDESSLELGDSYDKQLLEVVKKYSQNSDRITVEFIDIDKNPNVVAQYSENYKGEITSGNVVVTSGEKIKVLTATELYNIESSYYYSYIASSKAEQALTSAVMNVTNANPKTIGFLTITSTSSVQASVDTFKSTLESNGYELVDIDLMSVEKIDSTVDLIVIPAPLNDFTTTMTDKLTDFLYNNGELGKNVFYMANYDQNKTPNLDKFLNEWGIQVGDGYIYETDENLKQVVPVYGMQNYISSSVAKIVDEENFGGLLSDESLPIIAPVARPLTLLFDTENDRETKVILSTSETSTIIPVSADSSYDISDNETGVQNVMVMGSKYLINDANEKITSNVTVTGSGFMADYYMISETAYNNGEFLVNALNQITGNEGGITIVAKSIQSETITINEAQTSILTLLIFIVIPVAVAVTGVIVCVRRRNR